MTTSQPLQQTDLFGTVLGFPTSSSARRPARTSAAQTPRAKASTESAADFTSRPSGSLANADLVGSLLRIALISELEAQTGSSMRWRQSATPAGHSWSVLETSAPITSASEAGLSGSVLPTPMASDGMAGGKGGGAGSTFPFRSILGTPTKSSKVRSESFMEGRAPSIKEALFHTPTTKANFAAPSMQKWESCKPWQEMLETLPTPTKRDKRLDSWSPAYDRRKSPTMDAVMDGAMTGRASDKWAGARALAALLQSHGLSGTAALPITYGWMMGYPAGWLSRALQSAVHAGQLQLASSSKRSATQSYRKSQRPSAAPSGA